MPNNYIHQPIQIHELKSLQNFRLGECEGYENTYVRTGTNLHLPNILIKRLTTGVAVTATLFSAEDVNQGALTPPGTALQYLDAPVNAYEVAIFDHGNWVLPSAVPAGLYYILFNSGFFQFWSDGIYITEAGDIAGYPPDCDGKSWVKLRWREPECIYSGKSTDNQTNVLAYPEGMIFFVFLKGAALIAAEWEALVEDRETGSGLKVVDKRRGVKRYNLQGIAVSEAVIDAMQSSAFFNFAAIYFPGLADPLLEITEITVEASTADNGCTFDYNYRFSAGYLLKQGCCP